MNEQSPDQRRPKVRRAGIDDVEKLRAGPIHTGGTDQTQQEASQAQQEAFESVAEKLSRTGEEPSRATDRGQSGLRWPFQATQHVTEEWVHFFGRALERNSRAAADLRSCSSVASLLHRHWDLVQINVEDWLQTSFAVFGASCSKSSHTKAATETASV
jgi:hypothetical protein